MISTTLSFGSVCHLTLPASFSNLLIMVIYVCTFSFLLQ